MSSQDQIEESLCGFEQGPIRPPSEAGSLLLRVSRNCPWNRCTFCPLYTDEKFSLRSLAEITADIDAVARHLRALQQKQQFGPLAPVQLRAWHGGLPESEQAPFRAAMHWLQNGMRSVFLQDADGLVGGSERLLAALQHLRQVFPQIERITCYSRSATVVRYALSELQALSRAGLDRLHLGMESGSDQVLKRVRKGATQALHIQAGQLVRQSGIELSLYVMPGLGGRDLSAEHARQTAVALNQIDPEFIRLRTLAVPPGTPLDEELRSGRFVPCSTVEIAQELVLLLQYLQGISSVVVSDHALNLFEDLEGRLPGDMERMLAQLCAFLALQEEERTLYLLGRRAGCFRGLNDLRDPALRSEAQRLCQQLGVTSDNVEEICAELMKRYI